MKETGVKIKYLVGTMIEVPRGALTADQIADEAQFFSFGTNDLTQMAFGFSRDDIGKFLRVYQDKKILEKDPFATIDVEGVGALVRIGVERGRAARPDLKIGICGEHGGDPASVHFFESVEARLRQRVAVPHSGRPPGGGAGGDARQGRGLIAYYVYRERIARRRVEHDRPAWLTPGSDVRVWVDVRKPTPEDAEVLRDDHSASTRWRSRTRSNDCSIRKSKPTAHISTSSCTASTFKQPRPTRSKPTTSISSSAANYLVTVHDGPRRSIAEVGRAVRRATNVILTRARSR